MVVPLLSSAVMSSVNFLILFISDWNMTDYVQVEGHSPIIAGDNIKLILPLVLQYLCPVWVLAHKQYKKSNLLY
jgi:hypothetical protein